MAPAAFFFSIDALEKADSGAYNLPALEEVFTSLLAFDADRLMAFEFRQGDLLLHNLCYSPAKVEFEAQKVGTRAAGVATTSAGDTDLFKTLIWDLIDSTQDSASFDADRFYRAVGYRDAFVLSFSALDTETLSELGSALNPDICIGFCEVDPGSPIQRYAFIDSVVHSFDYRDRSLFFDPWRSEEPFDPPPLDRHIDEWYMQLDFEAVRYLTEEERADADFVPAWPEPATSKRGARSEAILEQRHGKGHLTRLASEAGRMRVDQDTLPFSIEVDAMPGASDAIVDEDKLTEYALNPEHKRGRHKARWFKGVLGIEARDWRHLSAQIRQGLLDAESFERLRTTPWGVQYSVETPVEGLNGVTTLVTSAWEVAPGQLPRLTTVAPGKSTEPEIPAPPALTLPAALSDAQRWPALWEIACAYAAEVAAEAMPTPMKVGSEWMPEGAFGFATVAVRDARRGFARWLVRNGHADTERGRGAVLIVPPRTIDRAQGYAEAFAEVLLFNGIEAAVTSQLN